LLFGLVLDAFGVQDLDGNGLSGRELTGLEDDTETSLPQQRRNLEATIDERADVERLSLDPVHPHSSSLHRWRCTRCAPFPRVGRFHAEV